MTSPLSSPDASEELVPNISRLCDFRNSNDTLSTLRDEAAKTSSLRNAISKMPSIQAVACETRNEDLRLDQNMRNIHLENAMESCSDDDFEPRPMKGRKYYRPAFTSPPNNTQLSQESPSSPTIKPSLKHAESHHHKKSKKKKIRIKKRKRYSNDKNDINEVLVTPSSKISTKEPQEVNTPRVWPD